MDTSKLLFRRKFARPQVVKIVVVRRRTWELKTRVARRLAWQMTEVTKLQEMTVHLIVMEGKEEEAVDVGCEGGEAGVSNQELMAAVLIS